jgi:hypothetical protein
MSHQFQNQKSSLEESGRKSVSDLLINNDLSRFWLYNLLHLKSGSVRPGDFINQLKLIAMIRRPGFQDLAGAQSNKSNSQMSISQSSISSQEFKISVDLAL